jgi:uridine kinase
MSKIILVGGGTASGKTYVIDRVVEIVGKNNVTHLSIDDYYKALDDLSMEDRKKVNFDHPKAFDWKLIKQQLTDLKNNKSINKPTYDFVAHNRSSKTEIVQPNKIVIVEGIMALVNKDVRNLGDLKIFINASRERRLLRRIDRDKIERGRTYDSIVHQYFETVQPMYEEVIAPSSYYADLLVNNDGIDNKSIEVIASVLKAMLNGEIK